MPRENRKRGKKHKKTEQQVVPEHHAQQRTGPLPSNSGEPSWVVSAPRIVDIQPEAPFGYVDPDVKAYFRTVDEQIRTWQEERVQTVDEGGDLDPNEGKRVFFVAALGEMSGKEKQLATDPDCSLILERMAYSMDDFVLRVLMDRLSGSFEALFRHRFASHVCQTLLLVAASTISREVKNIFPDVPASEDNGELRTLTHLILDLCREIAPSFNSLIMDPFASHVLRSLLLLLCPTVLPEDSARRCVRSKKSTLWKAKQGQMKSVFSNNKEETHPSHDLVPGTFRDVADKLLRMLKEELNANEVRALAANKVASPLLHLVLEIEADHGSASSPDSLMDRVLVGMIKACHERLVTAIEPSDYLLTLLRDPASSRLLETSVSRCPRRVFDVLWSTYFQGKLARLALHPIANFVVAKAIERQSRKQFTDTLNELKPSWSKLIKTSRTGVLRALIDRAHALKRHQNGVCEAVFNAVEISSSDDRNNLVPCLLLLKSLKEYRAISMSSVAVEEMYRETHGGEGQVDDSRDQAQGSFLLQSLLRLDEPHCLVVVDSISSLPIEEVIRIAHNATSSRVLDALFESQTVPFKSKRRFVASLIGHYHHLVDDRIGSRVGDRCWAFADPHLREQIARSLVPFEQFLAASFYGKFFARNLNLYLLQRRPAEWRTLQSDNRTSSAASTQPSLGSSQSRANPPAASTTLPKSSKRCRVPEDEIDEVFGVALANKTKKAAVGRISVHRTPWTTDQQMSAVLGAIREAPSGESRRTKRRKVHQW